MKISALILAALALVATSEAGRIHGTCGITVRKDKGTVTMDCSANFPDGSKRTAWQESRVQYPKICDQEGVICWQMNTDVAQNIDVFYANTVRYSTGTVSNYRDQNGYKTWYNSYDVNF